MIKKISIILFLALTVVPIANAASAIPTPQTGLYFGAWVSGPNGEVSNNTMIHDFETLINKKLSMISGVWSDDVNYIDPNLPDWNLHALQNIRDELQAVPLITLRTNNRTLSEIITNTIHPNDKRANYQTKPDDFFREWARGLKEYGGPVFLRLNHEMNGNWYLWSICALPNECLDPDTGVQQTPQMYIDAWRHVHDIFRSEGVTNVVWVWCPNFIHDTNIWVTPFDTIYPGDDYVDWTGLDVYNADTWPWRSFRDLIKNDYATLLRIAPNKPIMIAEFSSGLGGDATGAKKSTWIREAFSDFPTLFPRIKAIMWFNIGPDDPAFGSFRIEKTAATTDAFRQSVASSYYISTIPIPTPIVRAGDLNGDGKVDIFDYNLLVGNFGKTGSNIVGDIDKNGKVDIFDYNILVRNYGK